MHSISLKKLNPQQRNPQKETKKPKEQTQEKHDTISSMSKKTKPFLMLMYMQIDFNEENDKEN